MEYTIGVVLVVVSSVWAEYPANFPRCQYGDGACLTHAANDFLQNYSPGHNNLLPIEPFHVRTMILERDPTSAVNVELQLSNMDVFGFKSMKVTALNGFNNDLSGRNVIEGTVPELRLKGHYNVDGSVLVLPIEGDGPFEVQMKNVQLKFAFDFQPLKRNDQIYGALKHVKLLLEPNHIHFQFDNLFNGNQLLGDNMNRFINDNWHEIYDEIKQSSNRGLSLVLKSLINSFFEKYPYTTYFL